MNEFKFWLNLQEGLALKGGFKGSWFQRLVAAMYVLSPESEPEAVHPLLPNILRNQESRWQNIDRPKHNLTGT